jgi:hypothetical protein
MCLPLLIPVVTGPVYLAGGPLDARWLALLAVVGTLALWGGRVGGGRKAGAERERTALPLRTNCGPFSRKNSPRWRS